MSNYDVSCCDLPECTQEVKAKDRIRANWVVVEGRVWAFNNYKSPALDCCYCSWDHFTEAARNSFKK